MRNPRLVFLAAAVAAALLALVAPARAQQTSNVSSLLLSSGAELDFGLYGANGSSANTNGTNSDRIAAANQFNFSGSSASDYIVGFGHGDSNPLISGTIFTIVTFNSTNFTPADASRFTAAPRGSVSSISGNFLLNTVNGGAGSLQFQVTNEADLPEPPALLLLAPFALSVGIRLTGRRANRCLNAFALPDPKIIPPEQPLQIGAQ